MLSPSRLRSHANIEYSGLNVVPQREPLGANPLVGVTVSPSRQAQTVSLQGVGLFIGGHTPQARRTQGLPGLVPSSGSEQQARPRNGASVRRVASMNSSAGERPAGAAGAAVVSPGKARITSMSADSNEFEAEKEDGSDDDVVTNAIDVARKLKASPTRSAAGAAPAASSLAMTQARSRTLGTGVLSAVSDDAGRLADGKLAITVTNEDPAAKAAAAKWSPQAQALFNAGGRRALTRAFLDSVKAAGEKSKKTKFNRNKTVGQGWAHTTSAASPGSFKVTATTLNEIAAKQTPFGRPREVRGYAPGQPERAVNDSQLAPVARVCSRSRV